MFIGFVGMAVIVSWQYGKLKNRNKIYVVDFDNIAMEPPDESCIVEFKQNPLD